MIPVDRLLYKIDQRLNKLSSNDHQEIALEDKILALNEAQIKLVKTKFSGTSLPNQMGFGATKKRYQDIQNLLVDFNENSLSLNLVDSAINQWDAKLTELDPSMFLYASAYVLADKGRCKNRIVWVNPDLIKHGDVKHLLTNTNFKPSFEHQETFNSITGDDISIFTDGTFTPKTLKVLYLRYPQYIDKEGYVNFDGSESTNSDCELADHLEDELLELTVQNLADYTENMAAAQSARVRSQSIE